MSEEVKNLPVVATGPKPIIFLEENDRDDNLWDKDPTFLRTEQSIDLFYLSRDASNSVYDHVQRTPRIEEGGCVSSIIIEVKFPSAKGPGTEYFKLDWGTTSGETFTDRLTDTLRKRHFDIEFVISDKTVQYDGTPSELAERARQGRPETIVTIDFQARLDLASGIIDAYANVGVRGPPMSIGSVVAYKVHLCQQDPQ